MKRLFVGRFCFILALVAFENCSDASGFSIEENIPYSTVLLRTHYSEKIQQISSIKDKTPAQKETLKSSSATGGTGFFYVDLPRKDAEKKHFEGLLEKFCGSSGETLSKCKNLIKGLGANLKGYRIGDFRNESVVSQILGSDFPSKFRRSNNEEYLEEKINKVIKERDTNLSLSDAFNELKDLVDDKREFFRTVLGNAIFASGVRPGDFGRRDLQTSPIRFRCFGQSPEYLLEDLSRLFVVTNRHVFYRQGKKNKDRRICSKDVLFDFKTDGSSSNEYRLPCREGENVFFHPDYDVCLIGMHQVLEEIPNLKYVAFTRNDLIEEKDLPPVTSVVYMTGYPRAIYDRVNNLPVTRSGSIASPLNTNWNGRDEFLTDITVFKGSSGSPIFYLHKTITLSFNKEVAITAVKEDRDTADLNSDESIEYVSGIETEDEEFVTDLDDEASQKATKIGLLGILRSGPYHKLRLGSVHIPMGLGFVVKSHVIDQLANISRNDYVNISQDQIKSAEKNEDMSFEFEDLYDFPFE